MVVKISIIILKIVFAIFLVYFYYSATRGLKSDSGLIRASRLPPNGALSS